MTANSTVVSLANRALLSIGARAQIASLSEGSTESDAINVLYSPTFQSLARSAPWACLRKQASLSLIAAAQGTPENPDGSTLPLPPTPWLYQYSYPTDCLQVRYIVPSLPTTGVQAWTTAQVASPTMLPGGGQIPYAIAYSTDTSGNPIETILTNQTQAQVVYTVDQENPVIFDSMFEQALVSSLAAYLVPALSLNMPLMATQIKLAEAMITQARVRDGNEGVTVVDHVPDWMDARASGSTIYGYNGYAPYLYANYANMSWPIL